MDAVGTASGSGQGGQGLASAAVRETAALAALKARDRAVRMHEAAHLAAAAGIVVSGPSYVYQRGSDGQDYAVGGEVSIDVSAGRTPDDTLARARQIAAAALAPADPSAQDYAVAAQAQQMAQRAQLDKAAEVRAASAASAPAVLAARYRSAGAAATLGQNVDARA